MANQVPNLSLTFDIELEASNGQTTVTTEDGDRTATDQFVDLGADTPNNGYPTMYLQIEVVSSDDGDADETYVVSFENSSDNTFSGVDGPTGDIAITRGEFGRYVIAVHPTQRYARALMTVGGTTPSIVWSGFFGMTRG